MHRKEKEKDMMHERKKKEVKIKSEIPCPHAPVAWKVTNINSRF
jgi:hypothetical protein